MTIDAFYRLVAGLSNVNFGDFDMIGKYFSNNTEDAEILNGLNVTFLMLQVGKPCDCVCDCAGSVPKPETLPWCRLSFILTVMFRTQFLVGLYRVIEEKTSILWEIILSVIVRKSFRLTCV
jgi:hypothetical protein